MASLPPIRGRPVSSKADHRDFSLGRWKNPGEWGCRGNKFLLSPLKPRPSPHPGRILQGENNPAHPEGDVQDIFPGEGGGPMNFRRPPDGPRRHPIFVMIPSAQTSEVKSECEKTGKSPHDMYLFPEGRAGGNLFVPGAGDQDIFRCLCLRQGRIIPQS